MSEIQKVAVIGAGVMGAGIAAQIANAGVDVLLLDIVPKEGKDRDAIAKGAVEKLKKSNPAALMHVKNANRIQVGNIDDDLKKIADCDWIIEVVVERLDVKQDLYKKIDKLRKKDAIVSSNTSTLPLHMLLDGMGKSFRQHFMITHFFNPPRYMRLLEFVTSKETAAVAVARVREFADRALGKSVIDCNDTPGFIANRIGTYWLHASVTEAIRQNVEVETADALLGRPTGVPKTGVFGLMDLVGLDLMPHVLGSLMKTLPKKDPFHELGEAPQLLNRMIAEGYTGRKGKGGFYRLAPDGSKRKETIDLHTGVYRPAKKVKPAAVAASKKHGLRGLVSHKSPEGHYAWTVLSGTLAYAASLVPEIADNIEAVDRAMRLGYNWKYGPFELIDKLGPQWFAERLKAEGRPVPRILEVAKDRKLYRVKEGQLQYLGLDGKYKDVVRPEGVLLLEDIKRRSKPVASNMSASIWDIGDNVLCVEFHSKMNTFNPLVLCMINKAVKMAEEGDAKGIVIYNEAPNFSVGANIGLIILAAKLRVWPFVRWFLGYGQKTFSRMKYANVPVVGAPSGMALGGGCEVLLHCDAIEAHAETYMGLVEAGVGIIPGWGGCKEMIGRWAEDKKTPKGPMPAVMKAFELIATAQVAKSAHEAKAMHFLRESDNVVMNRDRVLAAAKARVLKMAKDYTPRTPYTFRLPGASGAVALEMGVLEFAKRGMVTPHDITVAKQAAFVLTGGHTDVTKVLEEKDILRLERDGLVKLAKTPESRARVMHMLKTGKPLRN